MFSDIRVRICLNMRYAVLYVTPVSRWICFAEMSQRVVDIRYMAWNHSGSGVGYL